MLYLFTAFATLHGQGGTTGDRPPEYGDMSEVSLKLVQPVAKARSTFREYGRREGQGPVR